MAGIAWDRVERDALQALEHAEQVAPNRRLEGLGPILRLWTYSTRGTYLSWTILVPVGTGRPSRALVREILWKRRQDEQRLASMNRKQRLRTKLRATLHARDANLSSEDLYPFLEAAARLFVPARTREEVLPEGDTSGFKGYRSLAYLRMEWRGPGPVEWTDAITWVARLRELLHASFGSRGEG